MKIRFTKMHGAGNDFVLVDGRSGGLPGDVSGWVREVCDRRRSVGADGVLILAAPESAGSDFRMRYYNADGGEAEMCGNGARCISRFALAHGIPGPDLRFTTQSGPIRAHVAPGSVRVDLGDARGVTRSRNFPDLGVNISSVNTGVPHAVLFVDDLEGAPVVTLGRAIRRHPAFAPAGTNADFVKLLGPSHISVRTYERGVEDETLACGTGITASAVMAVLEHGCVPPVTVEARSGDVLIVGMTVVPDGAGQLTLEGPAVVAFEGEMEWQDDQRDGI